MNLLIKVSNYLISEALCDLLKKGEEGFHIVVNANGDNNPNLKPDIILTDIHNINSNLFSKYPESKIILIDTGLKQEEIIFILLTYKIYGVLAPDTDIHLFKKSLKVVSKGEVWMDNSTIKAFLHNTELITKTGKIKGITKKENEVIKYASMGYKNKEIASKLFMSEHTVKAHMNRIFRKFNVSSRTQLIALTKDNNTFL